MFQNVMPALAASRQQYPIVFSIGCVLCWLAPFFWSGWHGRVVSWMPRSVTFQHTAAGLFTQKSTRWWDHHLEAQDSRDQRSEIDERMVFPMGAFGFRTRYDRILIEMNRSPLGPQTRLRLAEHAFERLKLAGPDNPPPKALRVVRSFWDVGAPDMTHPAGWWNPPPVTGLTGKSRLVLGTYQWVDGRVVEVARRGPNDPALARADGKPPPVPGTRPVLPMAADNGKPPVAPPASLMKRRQAIEQMNRLPTPNRPPDPRQAVAPTAPPTPKPRVVPPFRLGKPGLPVVRKPEGTSPAPEGIRSSSTVPAPAPPKPVEPAVPR